MFQVLGLGISYNDEVIFTIDGVDEDEVYEKIKKVITEENL